MSVWMQLFAAGSVGAIVVALVNGVFNRRKLSAEATQIITDAAGSLVQRLESDVVTLRQETARLQRESNQSQAAQRRTDERLAIHAQWDRQATAEAERQGFHLPPPPPLFSVQDNADTA